MANRIVHPFSITIGSLSRVPGRFSWSIRQSKQVVQRSHVGYTNFEEARVAGKVVLDQMITEWSRRAGLEEAA